MLLKIHLKLCHKYKINCWYVYLHKTNLGIPFYVGKGIKKRAYQLEDRSKEHKTIQQKYGCIIEIIYYTYDQEDAYKKEEEFVTLFHTFVGDPERVKHCCNKDRGGRGGSFGCKRSQEHCNRQSKRLKGKKRPLKFCKFFSEKQFIKIYQYDKMGKFLNEFESIKSASLLLNINHANISQCCMLNTQNTYAGDYIWRYAHKMLNKDDLNFIPKSKKHRQVNQYKNGVFIKSYQSIKKAHELTNTSYTSICFCCSGRYKTANGYEWKYADDDPNKY